MTLQSTIFYIFASFLLVFGLRVITAKNPVHAALFLVAAFFTAAALWLLLFAEFLAITLVLVYVGAVMVLFLFVVMMLDINMDGLRQGFWKHFRLAATLGAVIALEMAAVLMGGFRMTSAPKIAEKTIETATLATGVVPQISNTKELGKLLYSQYVYPLEIAAIILLVAMIAAIALTLRQRKDSKYSSPSDQVKVKAADRMTVIKMPPTLAAVDAQLPGTAVLPGAKA